MPRRWQGRNHFQRSAYPAPLASRLTLIDGAAGSSYNDDVDPPNHPDRRRSNHLADMNGDGWLDIIFANAEASSGNLTVFLQPSTPTQLWGNGIPVGPSGWDLTHLHGIQTANINADNMPDIVVAEMEQSVQNHDRVVAIYPSGTWPNVTWTKEDIHTGRGHEVRVWKEGNVTRIMTANHALSGGTAELRIWSGQ